MQATTSNTPEAPRLVTAGVHSFENRVFGENGHEQTINDVIEVIDPLLASLSVPERISRSTTISNGVQQEDLWRRTLDYSPKFKLNGKDYYVGVYQIIDTEGMTRQINFVTGDGPESIHLAALIPGGEFPNFPKVIGPRQVHANKEELNDTLQFAQMIAGEAPRQALEAGRISEAWMDASKTEEPIKTSDQGLPPAQSWSGEDKRKHELIKADGSRVVAVADRENGFWIEDLHPEAVISTSDVSAWREVGSILPIYYARQKYPGLYKND
jgi:hypothetical protein